MSRTLKSLVFVLLAIFCLQHESGNAQEARAAQNIKCSGNYDPVTWTNCIGSRNLPNGDSYSGGYLNGKANGQGTYQFADGRKFVGQYSTGIRNGSGTEYKSDGTIALAGQWIQGNYIGDSTGDVTKAANRVDGAMAVNTSTSKPVQSNVVNIAESKRMKRTSSAWYSINIGKMDNTFERDKSAFLTWYVENPKHHTSDCQREENPRSMIAYLKDPKSFDPRSEPKTSVTENELVGDVPVDITVLHERRTGPFTESKTHVRYIRGQAECLNEFNALVIPRKAGIERDIMNSKAAGDRYK